MAKGIPYNDREKENERFKESVFGTKKQSLSRKPFFNIRPSAKEY
jgi:hypothetical protein